MIYLQTMNKVCFNGEILNVEDIELNDVRRGFSFGDGAFETIKIVNGIPLFLNYHYKRLSTA